MTWYCVYAFLYLSIKSQIFHCRYPKAFFYVLKIWYFNTMVLKKFIFITDFNFWSRCLNLPVNDCEHISNFKTLYFQLFYQHIYFRYSDLCKYCSTNFQTTYASKYCIFREQILHRNKFIFCLLSLLSSCDEEKCGYAIQLQY